MNTILFKKDLDRYSEIDIQTLAKYYNITANIADLRWLIAIRHANKSQMLPVDANVQYEILKNLDDESLGNMCMIKGNEEMCMIECKRRYPDFVKATARETLVYISALKNIQKWLLKNHKKYTLKKLEMLEKLKLTSTVENIPDDIWVLRNLKELDLSTNKIKEIPESICGLQNLEILNLSDNEIEEVPECIYKLEKLTQINLDNNFIKNLPNTFGKLNLKVLNLTNNRFINIPPQIINLTSLSRLTMLSNNLTEIPKWISKLKNLEMLELGDNNISKVPHSIINLNKLKYLDLSDTFKPWRRTESLLWKRDLLSYISSKLKTDYAS